MNTRPFIFISLFLLVFANPVLGHEHWLSVDKFYPPVNQKIEIFISSGHYFPDSELLLEKRLIHDTIIIDTKGEKMTYEIQPEGKRWVSEVVFESSGTYVLSYNLRKPPQKEPIYYAKCIVLVEGGEENISLYELGTGLEIIPRGKICSLKKGDKLPVQVLLDGNGIGISVQVSIDGKKNFHLRSDKNGNLLVPIKAQGAYLLTCNYMGKGASLTFAVRGNVSQEGK